MATHLVQLIVQVTMDEMDGSPEESAEIAQDLCEQAIRKEWDANAEVTVADCGEVS